MFGLPMMHRPMVGNLSTIMGCTNCGISLVSCKN